MISVLKDPSQLGLRSSAINTPMSARLADAIESAGLKPQVRNRTANDWVLGDLLDEGPGWQDFAATRPRIDTTRRVRVYLSGAATSREEEDRLRREAMREFKLLEQLRHDAITRALDIAQADRGPAILFDRDEGEQRLDLWASKHLGDPTTPGATALGLEVRIELVRQIAEALAHAHANGVTHRSLSARSVLVRQRPGGRPTEPSTGSTGSSDHHAPARTPGLVVGHWQAGARDLATHLTSHGTSATSGATMLGADLAERLAADEQVYLAPETFTVEHPDPVSLDVFSLGSLAHLLLTGQPPAGDVAGRDALLREQRGLSLNAVLDDVPEELELLVRTATDPQPANRGTVRDVLDLLDAALERLTAPDPDDDAPAPDAERPDPLDAHAGTVLDGGWKVVKRLGSGSTAVALLCERVGASQLEVLKVARSEEFAERLRDEARALDKLAEHGSHGVVRLHGVDTVGDRTVLRLAPAGELDGPMTLADRLRAEGRLGLDLLERFGVDLIEILRFLESMGVPHRDIKPDNLGVEQRPGNRELHLVLFDFSLAQSADTNLSAGTVGYLDPFLPERDTKRWDAQADRYSVAATLYEMATGSRPVWGDGRTDPMVLDHEVPRLDAELLDPSVRDGLVRFFERGLHRRPGQRFDTPEDMLAAWSAVFTGATRTVTSTGHDTDSGVAEADTLDRLAAEATVETPVGELGLSGAAISVLERRGVSTVGQLLELPVVEWNRAVGVGLEVRREVVGAITRLREHVDPGAAGADEHARIDWLARQLIPKPQTARAQADQEPLTYLLGLAVQGRLTDAGATTATTAPAWPSTADLRAAFELDRAGYDELLERARNRWLKQPALTQVRNDVASLLQRSGGVLPGDEIAAALLAQRGCAESSPVMRWSLARAVVRAVVETEAARAAPRFLWRRVGGGAAAVVALQSEELDAQELADYASDLGIVADQLAATEPLPSPSAVADRLRSVSLPMGLSPLPEFRLVRLAAAASAHAAVSSRLELYPRGMDARRAVQLARAALLGSGPLGEDEVRSRVQARYPDAVPLPRRPELDRLLDEVVGLEWVEAGTAASGAPLPAGYRIPPPTAGAPSTAFGSSAHRWRTGTKAGAGVDDEARLTALDAHDRLQRHATAGGYLVLTVNPQEQATAIDALAGYGAAVVDLDRFVIGAVREHAEAKRIGWERPLLAADADGPDGPNWARLVSVVRDAVAAPLREHLLTEHPHAVLTHPGLLGRYDLLGVLDEVRDALRHPNPDQRLTTLWVLVAADDPLAQPTVAGRAVPVTTSAERMVLPEAWLRNLHQIAPVGDVT